MLGPIMIHMQRKRETYQYFVLSLVPLKADLSNAPTAIGVDRDVASENDSHPPFPLRVSFYSAKATWSKMSRERWQVWVLTTPTSDSLSTTFLVLRQAKKWVLLTLPVPLGLILSLDGERNAGKKLSQLVNSVQNLPALLPQPYGTRYEIYDDCQCEGESGIRWQLLLQKWPRIDEQWLSQEFLGNNILSSWTKVTDGDVIIRGRKDMLQRKF